MMRLVDWVNQHSRRVVVPLAGFPGAALTHTSIKQNMFNAELQYLSLYRLAQQTQPDAQFAMMDLSVEANALGLPVRFPLEESASVEAHPVKCSADLDRFRNVDILTDGRVWAFLETIRRLSQRLDIPVGGYVIGPFTLAGLLIGAQEIAMATIERPELVRELLAFCEGLIARYARAQVQAGAKVIAVLEPTAVILGPNGFWEFSGQSCQRLFRQMDCMTVLHICGNTTGIVEQMCRTGAQGLSLDTCVDFKAIVDRIPEDVVLIGNVDPVNVIARGSLADVEMATTKLLDEMDGVSNFILSTGCDIPGEAPIENIRRFVEIGRRQPIAV